MIYLHLNKWYLRNKIFCGTRQGSECTAGKHFQDHTYHTKKLSLNTSLHDKRQNYFPPLEWWKIILTPKILIILLIICQKFVSDYALDSQPREYRFEPCQMAPRSVQTTKCFVFCSQQKTVPWLNDDCLANGQV